MTVEWYVLILGFLGGFYMAWNIGANDVANSMASSVGAKAITLRQAIVIAGILNIVGAAFIGAHVTDTIRNNIISPEVLGNSKLALTGALAALLSAAMWISFATWRSLPVSTTHSIVGAMIGFGIIAGGFSTVNWISLGAIVSSWIISPVFSLIISYVLFKIIVRLILIRSDSYTAALRLSPLFIGITVFIIIMSFVYKTPLGASFHLSTPVACTLSLVLAVIAGLGGRRFIAPALAPNPESGGEDIFRRIQIGTACYVALAQGANDVANAIGPLALIYFIVKTGEVGLKVPVPFFLLLFGGVGIAIGIAMGGARVIRTVGERITTLTNTRGFAVEFATATTVLVASKLGLPVSTTHAAVGGVLGVGLAGGIEAVNFAIVFKIMVYWILTVPVSALSCMVVFKILQVFI